MTEEELEAARGKGGAGSSETKKEPAPAAKADAKQGKDDEAGKDGEDKGRGGVGDGASNVDRESVGLEQLSATGRQALDREESAGGV